jgi:phosphatidylglycerophosphatase A
MTRSAPPAPEPPSAPGAGLALAATWFGSGRLPWMPGTWGSLAALPGAALLHWLGGAWALVAGALAVTIAGVPVAARYAEATQREDPGEVVIDEVAGMWLTLIPLGLGPLAYLVGFAAFRLFDTLKPWPVRRAEALPGGYGIMADDVVAGALAALSAFLVLTGLERI